MSFSFHDIEKLILSKGIDIELCEGEYLYIENEPVEALYYLKKGNVILFDSKGRKAKMETNRLLNIKDIIQNAHHTHSAIASSDVEMVVVDKAGSLEVLTKYSRIIFQYILSKEGKKEIVYE